MNLSDWLEHLKNLHHKDIDLGLDRVRSVAQSLNLQHLPGKVVLIGGTNGKGTTSRFVERYLLDKGLRVGLFNSPHIHHYRETVRINGKVQPDTAHVAAFEHIEAGRGETSLSYFEYSALAAFKLFADANLDVTLIEVGLGGREDATNVVEPDISVLTTIALDHQAFLGDDRESIGWHKAGIFRTGKPAVVGEPDLPESVKAWAEQIQTELYQNGKDFDFQVADDSWYWQQDDLQLAGLPLSDVPLQNLATGLALLYSLEIPLTSAAVGHAIDNLVVEGRFQTISDKPTVVVDVAHNPQAAEHLARQLEKYRQQGIDEIHAVVGMFKDKDITDTLRQVVSQIDHWYLTDLPEPRGAKAAVLGDSLQTLGVASFSCYDDVNVALKAARLAARPQAMVIVFGSFATVAPVLADNPS